MVTPGKSLTSSSSASPRRWTPRPGVRRMAAPMPGTSGMPPTRTSSCARATRSSSRAIGPDPSAHAGSDGRRIGSPSLSGTRGAPEHDARVLDFRRGAWPSPSRSSEEGAVARRRSHLAVIGTVLSLVAALMGSAGVAEAVSPPPKRVVIVLFDQMLSQYADEFAMPNFRRVRDAGTDFKHAYLGYMASETVIAHNVITSGQSPAHMGWVDEAFRDSGNVFGKGAGAMHITGDLSLTDFGTLVSGEGYPKLADYLHTAYPGSKFITVGEKSYAVESATAASGDIAVRLSSRRSNVTSDYPTGCRNLSIPGVPGNGQWRSPAGKNVPTYLTRPDATDPKFCGRYFINSDKANDYGTKA